MSVCRFFCCYMENIRTSSRLARDASLSDEESSDDDYANESSRAPVGNPTWDMEDKKWKNLAVNKYVYFRWSTAHNSKNRFKGIVLDHRSRVPRPGYTITTTLSDNSRRVDYLDIKTFGISEDTYVMGKDIREMYVLPNKTVLMSSESEDEIRKHAIRKWTSRQGWIEGGEMMSSSTASTSASTPRISSSAASAKMAAASDDCSVTTTARSTAAVVMKKRKPSVESTGGHSKKRTSNGAADTAVIMTFPSMIPLADLYIPETSAGGIHGVARHSRRGFAHRIKFAFSNGIY